MHKPNLLPHERELVEEFKAALPLILAGEDPFTGKDSPDVHYETRKCAVDGCEWYRYQADLCFEHYEKNRK